MPELALVPRVLVADDQCDMIVALQLLLRGAGIDVDHATSVQEVRDQLSAQRYDLLLMDLNYARDTTSGREGLELIAEVHAQDHLLPVIAMTGWASVETAVEAMRRGARTYVCKPWDSAVLASVVRQEVERGRALRRADAHAARELDEARAIQRALLPATLPTMPGCDVAARWEPAEAFGGDCYDALRLTGSLLALSIADVCGKSLPAALLMSNLQASVRAFATASAMPHEVVSSVNRALCRHAALRRFVTCFYSVYDVETRRLTYCNAGHNPPVILRADESVVRLAAGGMVTGICEDAAYESGHVRLQPGDRVVLFTDGITEAGSAQGAEFGDERLVEAIRRHRADDARALLRAIFDEVAAFTRGAVEDDATAVALVVD